MADKTTPASSGRAGAPADVETANLTLVLKMRPLPVRHRCALRAGPEPGRASHCPA